MRKPMFRRITTAGYVEVYAPNHPRAANEMVHEHILVAERALGKYLPEGVEVHHVNEMKTDNGNSNLVVCQDLVYHRLLHARQRAAAISGDPDWRKCPFCKRYDDPARLVRKARTNQFYHVLCARAACRSYYALNRQTIRAKRSQKLMGAAS